MPGISRHLNAVSRTRAITLLENGISQRSVANRLRVSPRTIRNLWNRFQETGSTERRPGSGRQRVTSEREDRFIQRIAVQQRFISAPAIQNQLQTFSNVLVSDQTIRNRLRESQLRSRRRLVKPKMTTAHRAARLRFAREHNQWDMDNWQWVLFSDECKIKFNSDDRHIRVWRRTGERFSEPCIHERDRFGGPSVMVWGGINATGKTELVFFPDSRVTSDSYIEQVIRPHVIPFAQRLGRNFVFMHDNARPHVARATKQALREANIEVMDWPAISCDMNPIEHLWDQLKRKLRLQRLTIGSQEQLIQALKLCWDEIPQEDILNLIESMPNRIRECEMNRGGHTHY